MSKLSPTKWKVIEDMSFGVFTVSPCKGRIRSGEESSIIAELIHAALNSLPVAELQMRLKKVRGEDV